MSVDYGRLHESNESQTAPWNESRLFNMADMMLGSVAICDKCGRWQRFMGSFPREKLVPHGWTFGPDHCPVCNKSQTRAESPENRPMTDNEKAATFIGWEPDTDCPGFLGKDQTGCGSWEPDPGRIAPHWSMQPLRHVAHKIIAPDMADPRNYMKALEAVAARGLYVEISIYKAVGGPHYTGVSIRPEWKESDGEAGPVALGRAMYAEAGIAATNALAALYDSGKGR